MGSSKKGASVKRASEMMADTSDLDKYREKLKHMTAEELIVEERGQPKSLIDRAMGRESEKEKAAREEREARSKKKG